MRSLIFIVLAAGLLTAQALPDTTDARSNAYIHEDWSYFAERMRNEFLALGEKKFRQGEYERAVMDYFNFIYHFPEDELIPLVHYRLGRAYELMGAYEQAREQYAWVWDHPGSDPRVKMVCLRQLARIDYELGRYEEVLRRPELDDPYLLVLKGFAALTAENWSQSGSLIQRARHFYPARAQVLLDSLLADIEGLADLEYYAGWKGRLLSLFPGGSLFYVDNYGDGLGHALGVGSLAAAAALTGNWTRYVLGAGAVGLYGIGLRSYSRAIEAANREILNARLAEIKASYGLDRFWSFAHPAIF
ncbi:MAG: hypothetical protein IIB42_00250 [Candidatus Marinimicrobia bacterium]|nr:hypothetical protein [Candidatus Neomarinimicrobiota bacterium]